MKLTAGQIRDLLKKREDERVEFKRAASELPDNLWETYRAFCNTGGGTIILGIREGKNKTYSIEGVSNAHKLIDDFWSAANSSEKVSYSIFFGHYVYPVKCGRKTVVVIEVPRAPREARPVYVGEDVFKGSFRRNGEGDYHGRRGIVVEKHFRTITFSNPGTMRVSKSVAVAGGTSDARNSAIFNIFALVDIGERSGMGLANLHGLWKKYGYAEPKITESYDPDRTVLVVTTDDDTVNDTVTRPENGAEPDQNPTRTRPEVPQKCPNGAPEVPQKCPNGAPEVPQKCPKSAPKVPQKETADLQGLTAAVRQVYKAMCEDISMTHRGIESKLGLASITIRKATATLVQKGFIRRVGPKKGGHWEVMP